MLKSVERIIKMLQDNPQAYINYSRITAKAHLNNGDEWKSINFDTFLKVRNDLIKLPYNGRSSDRYNLTGVTEND